MNDFLNGKLYMNNILYFKENIEESTTNYLRADKNEGVIAYSQADNVKLELNGHIFQDLSNETTIYYTKNDDINIFCLYAISTDDNGKFSINNIKIDKKNNNFGKYIVLIDKPNKFIKKVLSIIKKEKLPAKLGHVNYYNEKESYLFKDGDELFNKTSFYSYQKEYRIVLNTKNDKLPYILNIGNIKKLCMISSIDEINNIKIENYNK